MIYTFICDPDECDSMIVIHVSETFDFPNGEVKMNCPCGRRMHYISLANAGAA